MIDRVDAQKRSLIMSRVGSKNTRPEKLIRSGLFALGYRFRIHNKDLPGTPDIVLKKYSAVILVNGCFWHGHNCSHFRMPKSNVQFWEAKITRNAENDRINSSKLLKLGWRVATVLECSLNGKHKLGIHVVIPILDSWLNSDSKIIEIRSNQTD